MNPPVKHNIPAKSATPAKKVISSALDQQVDVSLNVEPAPVDAPTVSAVDVNQAVDYVGAPIKIGAVVDIYSCKVVGLRPDANNRLNVMVVPFFNNIVTPDPNNPLAGQQDGKAILISGYHCTVILNPTEAGGARAGAIDAGIALKASRDANPPTPVQLPSNFLAPSLE